MAIDVTLLSRYYERFANHAVSVARLVFLVTGEQDEQKYPPESVRPQSRAGGQPVVASRVELR
jgi:hypothetical protein